MKHRRLKKAIVTCMAAVCALSSAAAISADAASYSLSFDTSTKKVSATYSVKTATVLVISRLQCYATNGESRICIYTKKSTSGAAKSITAILVPGTGYNFVKDSRNYISYASSYGSGKAYYWK